MQIDFFSFLLGGVVTAVVSNWIWSIVRDRQLTRNNSRWAEYCYDLMMRDQETMRKEQESNDQQRT